MAQILQELATIYWHGKHPFYGVDTKDYYSSWKNEVKRNRSMYEYYSEYIDKQVELRKMSQAKPSETDE